MVDGNHPRTTFPDGIQNGGMKSGAVGAPCFSGQAFPVGATPLYLDTADYNRDASGHRHGELCSEQRVGVTSQRRLGHSKRPSTTRVEALPPRTSPPAISMATGTPT